MTARSEIQRLLASAFEKRGWEYDLSIGPTIAERIETGERDPAKLARSVPSNARRRLGASLEDVEAALSEVLRQITSSSPEPQSEMRVLFVAASPQDELRLRLDAEVRDVRSRIRASTSRDKVRLETALAARPTDLIDELNRVRPNVLHLAGHGGPTGIALETEHGLASDVTTEQLVRLVSTANSYLRLVVLNSCDSDAHARPITDAIDAAIGMARPIGDEAARVFAAQLYSSLAERVSLETAFKQACLQINLAGIGEDSTPSLFVSKGMRASEMRFAR